MTKTIAIRCRLAPKDASEIDLLLHRVYAGQSSPCVIVENGNARTIGGNIPGGVDEMLEDVKAKYPGCVVKDRFDLMMNF